MTENNEEIQLTDGQTENLPETQTVITDNRLTDLQPGCGEMTTSPDDRYYTQGEFEAAFNEFLVFLKSPQTSLDAQITARQNRVANPFYRLLYGIGQEMLQTADNNKILSLLDKYEIPAFKNCFNEYRFIIKQQSSYRPHNLAQLRQQQKSRT